LNTQPSGFCWKKPSEASYSRMLYQIELRRERISFFHIHEFKRIAI